MTKAIQRFDFSKWTDRFYKLHFEMLKDVGIEDFRYPQSFKEYKKLSEDEYLIIADSLPELEEIAKFYELNAKVFLSMFESMKDDVKHLRNWEDQVQEETREYVKEHQAEFNHHTTSKYQGTASTIDGGTVTYGDYGNEIAGNV